MEYHSFLFNDTSLYLKDFTSNFPSPCGVIFILTKKYELLTVLGKTMFPSPYGVLFKDLRNVVVGFGEILFPSPYGVSFILIISFILF